MNMPCGMPSRFSSRSCQTSLSSKLPPNLISRPQAVRHASRTNTLCHAASCDRPSGGGGYGGGNGGKSEPSGHGADPGRGSPGKRWKVFLTAATVSLLIHSTVAVDCASASRNSTSVSSKDQDRGIQEINTFSEMLWGIAGPVLSNLGFSGVLGVAGGMAVKKLGQVLAVVLGAIFISLQGLVYLNLITVNWVKVNSTMLAYFDVDRSGRKLDEHDFKLIVSRGVGALSAGVPSVGGFLAGFMIGLRL